MLRKEPFDKVVRDARQSGLGWVVFLDWHYTFMMNTNAGARAARARAAEGGASGEWLPCGSSYRNKGWGGKGECWQGGVTGPF